MRTKDLVKFIKARENERLRKQGLFRGRPDPIIAQYRFCNVRRNDDAVTVWVHREVLERYREYPDLWFALTVARIFNLPESLEPVVKYMLPFQPDRMAKIMKQRAADGKKVFNAAYIISTNGLSMNKIDYVMERVLKPLWKLRPNITASLRGATLAEAHALLMKQNGLGSFLAAQVLADLKYADPMAWKDFATFAAIGPGSRRGLNRVMDRPISTGIRANRFTDELSALRDAVNEELAWEDPITAQDLQNCLCEFDKYERARLGEGRPKQLYNKEKK